ncbi:helix-turn-helix domain-containing protein [Coraliomargarita akajimensis]|nr:AraC family transcriptional regulator [Coraliomargarita akajimensis]
MAHISWLAPFVAELERMEVNLEPFAVKARIPLAQLRSTDSWISKQQLYGFLNAAAEGLKVPEFGFRVGEQLKADTPGLLWDALRTETSLSGVLRQLCRFLPRANEDNHLWVEEGESGQLWLLHRTHHRESYDRRIADHAGLMYFTNFIRLVAGPEWYPQQARLQTEATDAYQQIPGLSQTRFEFGCTGSGIAFPASWLDLPIAVHAAASVADANCKLLPDEPGLRERLERLLNGMVGVGGEVPSVDFVAQLAGMSARTFHRRMEAEGIRFQDVLDKLRLEYAQQQLAQTDVTVNELAFELGFSGANNFVRFFKRMSGQTPGQYRTGSMPSSK